jgi:hypothetical protein
MRLIALLALGLVLGTEGIAFGEGPNATPAAVSVEDVLAMMAQIPNECALYGTSACNPTWKKGPIGYDKFPDAREIAEAIAAGVDGVEAPRLRAAQGAVYAAYESNNRKCAMGDGGAAHGAWQLQGVPEYIACDPLRAFPIWLGKVRASEKACAALPVGERFAAVASGNCEHGRVRVRIRIPLITTLAR